MTWLVPLGLTVLAFHLAIRRVERYTPSPSGNYLPDTGGAVLMFIWGCVALIFSILAWLAWVLWELG